MRVGVIGAGRQGQKRIADLLALGETDLMIFDADRERVRAVRGKYGVGQTGGVIQPLWDWQPEAVLICTPPDSHEPMLSVAYAHGVRAMFVEKPLALIMGDCNYSDCVTMVGCNWRFHDGPSYVKAWFNAGVIGEPRKAEFHAGYYLPDVRADWKDCYVATTGATLDIGWHMVDLALDWFGPAILDASHLRGCPEIGWPDTDTQAALFLLHDSGVSSVVTVNLLQSESDHYASVDGKIGKTGYSLRYQNAFWRPYGIELGGESIDLDSGTDTMCRLELSHFLDCVRDGKQTINPVSRARETLAILLEAKMR